MAQPPIYYRFQTTYVSEDWSTVTILFDGAPCPWRCPEFAVNYRGRGGRRQQVSVFNPVNLNQMRMRQANRLALIRTGLTDSELPLHENNRAVRMELTFFMPRPSHHFVPGFPQCLASVKPEFRHAYPVDDRNLDNLIKFVLDSPCRGLLFKHDRQVVSIVGRKVYEIFNQMNNHHLEFGVGHVEITCVPLN